jgi:DedD protein
MDNRMRDLDLLEERDPQDRGRRNGMAIMFGLVAVGLVFAVGSMMSKAAAPDASAKADPLDQLGRVLGADRATKLNAASDPEPNSAAAPALDPTQLTFQRELTEEEDRPEVIEALAAAAREEESLGPAPAAQPEEAAPAPQPSAATPLAPSADALDDDDEAVVPATRITKAVVKASAKAPPAKPLPSKDSAAKLAPKESAKESAAKTSSKATPAKEPARASIPAGLTASIASQKLAKAARHDKLVAAALPDTPEGPKARVGADGEFTLQVISYDSLGTAQAFANELRAKGHEAFVAAGDVEGRGRYYRVRIGPFKTKPQAEAYRRSFEEQEAMNTIVVKRPDR